MKEERKKISKDTKETIITGVSFVFGTFCLALCYNLFFNPNDIVVGGMSGLAIVVNHLTGFNSQIFIYVSSTLLLIVSYIFLGKEEAQRVFIGIFISHIYYFYNSNS